MATELETSPRVRHLMPLANVTSFKAEAYGTALAQTERATKNQQVDRIMHTHVFRDTLRAIAGPQTSWSVTCFETA